jgi:hypothetical protein
MKLTTGTTTFNTTTSIRTTLNNNLHDNTLPNNIHHNNSMCKNIQHLVAHSIMAKLQYWLLITDMLCMLSVVIPSVIVMKVVALN